MKPILFGSSIDIITNTIVDNTSKRRKSKNDAIRCMGMANTKKKLAFARMHNKFLIFCKIEKNKKNKNIEPYAVWTGSLNMTDTATRSFENSVCVKDKKICKAYMKEWAQIYALAEPLNWTNEECEPELYVKDSESI